MIWTSACCSCSIVRLLRACCHTVLQSGMAAAPWRTERGFKGWSRQPKRSSAALSLLMDIYTSRRAKNIIKDSSHPGFDLFHLLPSGSRYRAIKGPPDSKNIFSQEP
ncbi:hypothetical protein NQD34_005993 [Periophthalmus magnuspinnatus]|nr:hypothetical protein NQD34_005993 [Periophthalmus magnuspinnatus]